MSRDAALEAVSPIRKFEHTTAEREIRNAKNWESEGQIMGFSTGLRLCLQCSRHASGHAKPRSGLHSHRSKLLYQDSAETARCSCLEMEMDFGEGHDSALSIVVFISISSTGQSQVSKDRYGEMTCQAVLRKAQSSLAPDSDLLKMAFGALDRVF